MADNSTLDPGAGGDVIRDKDRTGVKTQIVGIDLNIGGAESLMAGAMPVTDNGGNLSIDDGGNSITVDGTVTANAGTGPFPVSDNAGSLTVDASAATFGVNGAQVAGTATSVNSGVKDAGTQRVILASDQTVVPVSDNAGSLTVDAPVATPAFVRLSDGAAAITALPVTDNAGSLTVDSTQLPAALAAGGGIKVEGVAGGVVVPVSGTVTANAGSGPFPVSDNAGSLTVDAPVGTPAFVRLSDGASAITALPITDNAGSLTVDAPVATPVNVQLSDGTDTATILPVRTQPATTEKVLVTSELPSRLATYQCVTAEVAPPITIGVKELLTFFHPAAVTQDVYIVEIVVSVLVTTASTTAGRTNVEVFKTTSAGTGGTNLAAADVGGGLGTSAVITNAAANVMQVKTGGGALGTALIRQGLEHATEPLGDKRYTIFNASSVGNGIIMRGGSADGINIQVNRVAAHTALVDQWTASIRWIEL